MALIGEKLASNAALHEVMCVCSGHGPKETRTEGLTYKGPGCCVVAAESGMDFCQQLPPFLFRDAPLKDSGCAFLIKFSLMDLVGFRSPNYAAGLVLVFGKFLPN